MEAVQGWVTHVGLIDGLESSCDFLLKLCILKVWVVTPRGVASNLKESCKALKNWIQSLDSPGQAGERPLFKTLESNCRQVVNAQLGGPN